MANETPDEKIHYIDQISLIALRNRLDPDELTWFRRICREFSILFHMPLVEVEKLNLEYMLLHLKEYEFDKADETALRRAKHNLLSNTIVNKDKDDEEWEAEMLYEAVKQEQEELNKKNAEAAKKELPPNIELTF